MASSGLSLTDPCPSHIEDPRAGGSSAGGGLTEQRGRTEQWGRIPSLTSLLWDQPRTLLAFWAGSTHGWDMFSFLFTTISKVDPEMLAGMRIPHEGSDSKQCSAQPDCPGHVPPGAAMALGPFCRVSHLWRFFVGFTVESAYPSAFQVFVISWRRLTGFPLELSTVTGFMDHFLLWWLVLGLCFYRLHGLDIYPGSELISTDQKGKGFRN